MKKRMSVLSLYGVVAFSLLLSIASSAQSVKPDSIESKMFNNAIYGSIGFNMEIIGDAWLTGNVYYERMFQRNAQKSKVSTFLKAGLGSMAYWEGTSSYVIAQYGVLTGIEKHHLEASGGFVFSLDKDYDIFPLSGSVGYRMQKPTGHFIFRTGVGWPEALYIGIGASF